MLATTLFVACSPDQDEIFKDSAAERVAASMKKIEQTLESSPNGWHFELFTGTGGTNVMLKFADGKVQASDYLVHGSDVVKESLYSMVQNGGPVLSFDTYNEVFHAYSDPVAPGESTGDNEGLGADFEFVVQSCTNDLIILRGLKHQRLCRMTRQPEADDWATTLGTLKTINDAMKAPSYEVYFNDVLVGGTNSITDNELITYRTVAATEDELLENPDATEKLVKYTVSLVPTLDGFRTEEPFSYDVDDANPTIQNFTYDVALDRFVCKDAGVNMYIQKIFPPINETFATTGSTWQFPFSFAGGPAFQNMSPEFEQALTLFQATDSQPYGETFTHAFLGANAVYPARDSNPFALQTYSSRYIGVHGYTCKPVVGTENQVVFSDIKPGYQANYYPTGEVIANLFVDNGPWILESDNDKDPSQIKFTCAANSDIYITLYKYQ